MRGKYREGRAMSALPPKADISVQLECPLCANSGHRPDLLDHLICTQQKLFGDRQTQRFGGGQIDD